MIHSNEKNNDKRLYLLFKRINYRRWSAIILTFIILLILLESVGITGLLADLERADWKCLSLALIMTPCFIMVVAFRWCIMIRTMGFKISYVKSLKVVLGSLAFNVIVPAKGGDFVKCWPIRDVVPLAQGAGIIIAERIIDVSVLCLMVFIGSIRLGDDKIRNLALVLLTCCLIGVLVLWLLAGVRPRTKFWESVQHLGESIRSLKNNPLMTFGILLLAIVIWIGTSIQVLILYHGFGVYLPLNYSLSVIPVIIFVGLIPITIGGMGTRDAAFIYFFSMHAADHTSLAVGLLFTLFRYWLPALMSLPFLWELYGKMNYMNKK